MNQTEAKVNQNVIIMRKPWQVFSQFHTTESYHKKSFSVHKIEKLSKAEKSANIFDNSVWTEK